MLSGWRYRIASATGVICLTIGAVLLANHPTAQLLFTTYVPLFNRLEPTVLTGDSLQLALLLSVAAIAGSLVPLYKPRPRRILDTIFLAQKRVLTGGLVLATLGFFKWSHRLPRATLTMLVGTLLVVIPLWFVWIRRPADEADRAILVGDDLEQIRRITPDVEGHLIGCLCPTYLNGAEIAAENWLDDDAGRYSTSVPDGGATVDHPPADERVLEIGTDAGTIKRLGGLSRLEDVIREYDVDTAVLAFRHADRAEFFGALDACYEHGVAAKVHREFADAVLTSDTGGGPLVDVEIEPWDPQDYVFKRLFDIAFATVGLLVLTPIILGIAIAIKLDDGGSILYEQERTAAFGETFSIYKFRSMIENAESQTGVKISEEDAGGTDPRVTKVGRILRQTHMDEIPQLWSVLVGNMSVVGPRPERPELDADIQIGTGDWHKRWFVKPGLTGLAQVNDVTGYQPKQKLRHDIKYIKKQSFWVDLRIVVRQIWKVLSDMIEAIT
ncbi:exopolysaccharide biosynthesis polyprenyl glycosylphosphotransferase [Halalkaliarchaeum desulfuricum]|uniref:Exopolysaccharide biosynthesis polyprenyl glycosylphosphotransferase n=1 Tax=Halalkaliarchaeum desulfuricum TaxID=2055893 RepID=A0A343TNC0_9EURY|nr:sugar transferase [Halalkaliarchaeum desulfuricum]AUX10592.1 exopolysaccharide biosynthesis polyprenyl glycosylphosphotransferase [Halalkaliarchaeum desulfuricum]